MKIINHPACTHQLGAPSDMQDGSCDALPVMYQDTEHGQFAVSFWQPEPDDLAELLAGGGINLRVRAPGRQHPVVALGTFPAPPVTQEQESFILMGRRAGKTEALLHAAQAHANKLAAENKALRDQVERLEKLRPHWAKGYTSDGVAAQCATGALQSLWDLLGAKHQTEAMQKLRALTEVQS